MNNLYTIVLCEGESDAILIGFYLQNILNWSYYIPRKMDKNLPKLGEANLYFYRNKRITDDNWIIVCPCNGVDSFPQVLQSIKENNDMQLIFNKIIIISDNDDKFSIEKINKYLSNFVGTDLFLRPTEIFSFNVSDAYQSNINAQIMFLLWPNDRYGAMESFIVDIIKDGYDEKEKLVSSIDLFIENIDHNNFLGQRREQVKAELSILLAVLFPEKIFESIRDYLETLDWSRYEQYKLFLSSINQIILE